MAPKQALSVVLIALMVSGIVLGCLGTGKAESIPKPSVPEFTVTYVDYSYYVPPVYGVDQYSGKTVQTGGGFTVQNKSLELKFKDQQFSSYTFKDGDIVRQVGINYQIRYKGHFGENWKIYTVADNSPSGYTVVLFGLDWSTWEPPVKLDGLQAGDQVDFEVQARIGYFNITGVDIYAPDSVVFVGESSGWSSTQTVTIPGTSVTSPSPTVPEFPIISILPILALIPLIATLLVRKKKVQT
jgi:hypothetical protein